VYTQWTYWEGQQPNSIDGMNAVTIVALWLNTSIAIVATSRLVFSVAYDGVLQSSGWISKGSHR
jgi:hypothetical protein